MGEVDIGFRLALGVALRFGTMRRCGLGAAARPLLAGESGLVAG